MNYSQLAKPLALLFVCVLLAAGCAAPTPAVQSATVTPSAPAPNPTVTPSAPAGNPTATPSAALTPTELKYLLLAKYPSFFFCDPDYYPVARADEKQLALQRWPEVQQNTEQYQTILRQLNLNSANLSDDQKLAVYREFKKLNALQLQPSGNAYTFQLRMSDSGNRGMAIEGTISKQGAITVTKSEPTITTCPICLAADTRIDTPSGQVSVSDLRDGTEVWTLDANGARVAAPVGVLPITLARLGGGASPCVPGTANGCLIDNNLATNGGGNGKSGYTFAVVVTAPGAAAPSTFYTTAVPISNTSGTKSFCAADDGVIRNGAAGTTVVPGSYANCLGWAPMNN